MSNSNLVRCDLYMLYTSQPDYALHRMNMSNITHVREIISKAESEISLVKDGLGIYLLSYF